jgi:hypothetical protein
MFFFVSLPAPQTEAGPPSTSTDRPFGIWQGCMMEPEQVPLNGNVLGTAKGTWVLRVDAAYVQDTDSLLLYVTLRGSSASKREAERIRRLGMLVPGPVLHEVHVREGVAGDIRGWIEATDGNGFLDLRSIL